jgi:Fe-S-cluster-containing dehydrogenase component
MKRASRALVLDLDRCVGCYACQLACAQEQGMPEGSGCISVVNIDPTRVRGEVRGGFWVEVSPQCKFCGACSSVCATRALTMCRNQAEILESLGSGRRIQICRLFARADGQNL